MNKKSIEFQEIKIDQKAADWQVLLPDNLNAIKYYIQHLFCPKKPSLVLLGRIIKLFHLYWFAKCFLTYFYCIVRNHPEDNVITSFLKLNWKNITRAKSIPQSFAYIWWSGFHRVILFPFFDAAERPFCVLKISRKIDDPYIQTELSTFEYLKSLKSPFIEKSIPSILYSGVLENKPILITETIRGVSLESLIVKKGRPFWKSRTQKNLRVVIEWLIEFNLQTKSDEIILESNVLNRYFKPILEAINKCEITDKEYVISKIEVLKNAVRGKRMPLVTQHIDFSPSNIFLDSDTVKVIDWVRCRRAGEPLYDAFWFLSLYIFFLNYNLKKEPIADYPTITKITNKVYFEGKGFLHNLLSKLIKDYCQQLAIDSNIAKMLFLWQEIAIYENFNILKLFFTKENKFII